MRLPTGHVQIKVETAYIEPRPGGPLHVTLEADGQPVADGKIPVSAPMIFSANDCLDIGTCLGSPVSLDYYDRAPFPFEGRINEVTVRYTA